METRLCALYLKPILQELVDNANDNSATNNTSPNQVNFVRAGENKPPTKTKSSKSTFLSGATDWRMLVELGGNKIVYPPEIYSTIQRPDIVIWSKQTKRVMNVELTCPAEEGIQARKSKDTTLSPMPPENGAGRLNLSPSKQEHAASLRKHYHTF